MAADIETVTIEARPNDEPAKMLFILEEPALLVSGACFDLWRQLETFPVEPALVIQAPTEE